MVGLRSERSRVLYFEGLSREMDRVKEKEKAKKQIEGIRDIFLTKKQRICFTVEHYGTPRGEVTTIVIHFFTDVCF